MSRGFYDLLSISFQLVVYIPTIDQEAPKHYNQIQTEKVSSEVKTLHLYIIINKILSAEQNRILSATRLSKVNDDSSKLPLYLFSSFYYN